VKATVPFEKTRLEDVEEVLPDLLRAKDKVTSELTRIMQDPMTGIVNKSKILTSRETITSRHEFNSRSASLRSKKQNQDDELQRLKECKSLLKKMTLAFKKHEAYKPQVVQ
jgi:hypothetical protein